MPVAGESEDYLQTITVKVALYGALAANLGKRYVASGDIELPVNATVSDLLRKLSISDHDRGYLFINAVLHDVPGLYASAFQPLHPNDHVGIFSTTHMWPYQYRDGVRMSPALKKAMESHGVMHNVYNATQTTESKKQEVSK